MKPEKQSKNGKAEGQVDASSKISLLFQYFQCFVRKPFKVRCACSVEETFKKLDTCIVWKAIIVVM